MRKFPSFVATAIAVFLSGLVVGTAPAAHAADVYRYWAYFTVKDGAFVAQGTGPADANPADGSIEAYRFAAPADFNNPNLPRADLSTVTFDSVCGSKEAGADEKRVAVLIDYGTEDDADGAEIPEPEALCAVVPAKANGMQTLQAVAPEIRTEKTMLCGISGYPASGCSDKADKATPPDSETVEFATADSEDSEQDGSDTSQAADDKDDDGSNTWLLLGAGLLVVFLGGGGVLMAMRKERS